ncbi:MAG: class I SAM-dependent methyltransferase [Bacteroidota bacterium]
MCPTRTDALKVAKGKMDLWTCQHCSHLFNIAFDEKLMDYKGNYENALHFSPKFQTYATNLIQRLVENYQLKGKHIVEIGCGDGQFLKQICQLGNNRGVGFDPSCTPSVDPHQQVVLFNRSFFEVKLEFSIDFICCRHVLEHVSNPITFLTTLHATLKKQSKSCYLYFEVPNADYMLEEQAYFDLIYEHFTYFTTQSLRYLFEKTGFIVQKVTTNFGGQFLGIEVAVPSSKNSQNAPKVTFPKSTSRNDFTNTFHEKIHNCKQQISQLTDAGKNILLWGAGSKGITLLNILQTEAIAQVIDINPRKHHHYVPGTGQKIISPTTLKTYSPDIIIVMNAIYNEEIQQFLTQNEISARIINW